MVNLSDTPGYQDKRSEFWRAHFDKASEYEAYIEGSEQEHIQRWRDSEKRIPALSEEQLKRLQGYDRELNVLVYSGIWCGDCARQGPLLKKLAEACGEKVKIKFIERDASPELMEELRIVGATRVPILVFLSEDFWEMARFGERTLSVYRAKAAREIGREFDGGILSPKAREKELSDWAEIFERVLIMLRLSPPLRRRHGD
ncbi:MAG: thioredoxin family protein [Candidatus Bathyarchaeota archaeon]|nr:thioredoxin family protein [Candidatus Bathyarchaeota archaeon]